MKLSAEQLVVAIVANRLQLDGHLEAARALVKILRAQCAPKSP